MTTTYPYISSLVSITSVIAKLRKNFPTVVTSATIKQYGMAKNNESKLINILRFIKIIDDKGEKIEENTNVFHLSDEKFAAGFSELIKSAYSQLFDLHGDEAWTLGQNELIDFFGGTDKKGKETTRQQVNVFQTLAVLCGKIDEPVARPRKDSGSSESTKEKKVRGKKELQQGEADPKTLEPDPNKLINGLGMSIRIEVNLPSNASKETYDHIFTSIRKNLIDA